jgi:TetR/AcrR family transcriptional regulator, transcriptional repressor for nem operon
MIAIIQNRMTDIIQVMGHSQSEKTRNHDRIVEIASRRIRELGTDGPGVADVMREAGLTHGGFYKHFGSREELVAEAARRSYADAERAAQAVLDGADDPLHAFAEWYLSEWHRDDPGSGCPVVALGGEIPRARAEVRDAYTEQVRRYLHHLEESLGAGADTSTLSTLVGALLLARAVSDEQLSARILRDAREAVVSKRSGI